MIFLFVVQFLSYIFFSLTLISSANIFDEMLLNCIISIMTQGCAVLWSGSFLKTNCLSCGAGSDC